jgi:hypothetical protein
MKQIFNLLLFFVCVFYSSLSGISQTKRVKVPSFFGIQIRPIIPINFFSAGPQYLKENGVEATISPRMGISFGGTVRAGITKLLAIETGISFVRRNYNVDYAYPDSSLIGNSKLGIISYDIPLNLLIYVKIKGNFYMNASMGASATLYPSNVMTQDNRGDYSFVLEGRRKGWFTGALNANFGFEYRTDHSGSFYLGASFQYPFGYIYNLAAAYKYKNQSFVAFGNISGAFLTLDIKYFFPTVRTSGKQQIEGPIEQ